MANNTTNSPAAAGGAAPAQAGQATGDLKQLIAQMKAQGTDDGTIELAMAIAAVSSKVTLTASPLKVTPPDLFQLTFDDPKVGISNAQMESVKSNLASLLPEIAADIAQIPDNADAQIEDAHEFVRLALLKAARG